MKITMPENLKTPFAMLMKGVPEELLSNKKFKDAVLVFLKMGGISLARKFVETKIRYLDYDPLEIDTGFRFPRLQEIDPKKTSEDEENEKEGDESEGEGEGEGEGKSEGESEKDEDKPLEEKKD
jgi:hypothetical protein